MLRFAVCFCLLCSCQSLWAQGEAGSGYALSFDGVDDYVDLGNVYDDLELPMTISAWIYLDVRGLGSIFASQNNSQTYNGFHFFVVQTAIIIEYGDGLGAVGPDFRRGKSGAVEGISDKWVHVAAVVRGPSDIDLFLNGVDIGGKYIGNSQELVNSNFPLERAQIGYRAVRGVNYHFQGMMDELRIWNRTLTENEIREQMCRKLTGLEPGLVGYWDFDEAKGSILVDKSPNHFDGVQVGAPRRVFSGAPIGDESISMYRDDWQGAELLLQDSLDRVTVKNIKGNPTGLHIYKVRQMPSQTTNLNLLTVSKPYFGIYTANRDTESIFDVSYLHNERAVCKVYARFNNSIRSWTEDVSQLVNFSDRRELIKELQGTPVEFDLGPDEAPCSVTPRILRSLKDTTGFTFLWQDGSSLSTYPVSDFGTYWLTVSNGCTEAQDTVKISEVVANDLRIPNVFTPNADPFNQYFEVDQRLVGGWLTVYDKWGMEVYRSVSYQNDWDGADLPTGVYFYSLSGGQCINEKKGALTILR
jgi:hypothetical protein